MRKTLVIIFAVALLGGAGVYAKKHDAGSPSSTALPSSSVGTSTGSSKTSAAASYKDGTYRGINADTPYGTVQVEAVVSGGKITGINFLKMPFEEGRSKEITTQAEPLLKQAAISAQSPNIDFVTGATSTSYGYQQSLQAALDQAKLS